VTCSSKNLLFTHAQAEWWFSRCENQRRVQRRNAFPSIIALLESIPPAATRAEFSQRENCHLTQ
jgi:hypothetical protein